MSDAAIRSTLPPPEPDADLDVLPAPSPRRAPDGPFKKAAKVLPAASHRRALCAGRSFLPSSARGAGR